MATSPKATARVLTDAGVLLVILWTQVTFAPGATRWVCLAAALAPIATGLVLHVRAARGRGGR